VKRNPGKHKGNPDSKNVTRFITTYTGSSIQPLNA